MRIFRMMPLMAMVFLAGAVFFTGCEKDEKDNKIMGTWVCHPEEGYTITLNFYKRYAVSHVKPVDFDTKHVYQFVDNDRLLRSNGRLVRKDFDESGFGFSMKAITKDTITLHFLGLLPSSLEYISGYTFVNSNH